MVRVGALACALLVAIISGPAAAFQGTPVVKGGEEKCRLSEALSAVRNDLPDERHEEMVELTRDEAKKRQIDPLLIVAFIDVESGAYNIEGQTGEAGYMQVLPSTYEYYEDQSITKQELIDNWKENIRFGIKYISLLQQKHGWIEAIGHYNCYQCDQDNWEYIRKVLNAYHKVTNCGN